MKLLTARYVVSVASPVIESGSVLIDKGCIVSVGRTVDLRREINSDTSVEDLGDVALLPGFINPHTHLELTCYKDTLPRAPLWEWFNSLLPKRIEPGAGDREFEGVQEGARQSLAAGVTLVGDISRTGITARALVNSPIRRISFIELISGAKLPPSTGSELEATLDAAERDFGNDRTIIGVSPHAPYTVTPGDLRITLDLATRLQRRLTMHVLETPEELEWLEGKPGFLTDFLRDRSLACMDHQPKSPVEYLSTPGLLDAGRILAHVNYVNDEIVERLAKSQSSIVYCPRAHNYYGHTAHPWRRLVEAGVNVCIGTDSLASNASLSILDELRYLAVQHPNLAAQHLLEMGTIRSAKALQLDRATGCIRVGAWADLCAIPTQATKCADVVDEIVRGSESPQETWIAGQSASTHRRP